MRTPPPLLLLVFSATIFLLLLPNATSLTPDGLSLLALKSAISSDPTLVLSAWKDSDPTPCNWVGITCVSNRVSSISLPNRRLSGYIPSEIGFLRRLTHLSLPHNNFSNPIPSHLFSASSLVSLDLSHNSLIGPIPPQIKFLKNLTHLDLSSNLLNGSLPSSLSNLSNLSGTLNLSYNLFSGSVPDSFGRFPVYLSLDLRHNNLSGPIPQKGSLLNQGPTAFSGNPSLCGFPLRSPCPDAETPEIAGIPQNPKSSPSPSLSSSAPRTRKGSGTGISVLVLSGLAFSVGVVTVSVWILKRRRWVAEKGKMGKGKAEDDDVEGQKGEFYVVDEEGGFGLELEELLRASAYVVGKSRNGIVYKVVVGRGVSVAVRRLGEEGGLWKLKEFEAEVEAIARVRHRNVVRLRAYYYATDEKLLVSDFISNGSLHAALHGGPLSSSSPLSWAARLKIAQGSASGLAHIHECSPRKYVHGNIKSSKILLDDDFTAYISGFGLNRLTSATYNNKSSTAAAALQLTASGSGLQGSKVPTKPCPSYLAPEARASSSSKLTQKCDVYSFGIVLLEILTGRSPDPGLESFVRDAFRKERPLSEVVDPLLLHEVHAKKQVLAVFHVALGCTEMDPEMRPRMRAVSDNLDRIG
ncbi:putative inactive leucine-rich repeat receptor-like protein kinase [Cinnamomum micranthum f. kanehirae]|uniref:Putative inactive leucine-rich repeat receptor-like protein kinase n=1 Tax=Cinnamomum micranthum f. kanehirae TaxID=337451 RepID=A0A3S3MS43_9MAGN|nr:putative inactive leucine-rich repeat receptor-like protein kinase [Cinnamomum micranthum f. kanehirae]